MQYLVTKTKTENKKLDTEQIPPNLCPAVIFRLWSWWEVSELPKDLSDIYLLTLGRF